jgi:DNA-binding transcriptional regulator YiaG
VSVVGFGGTTDVYDYVTEEAFKTNKKTNQNTENHSKSIKNMKKFEKTSNCLELYKHTGVTNIKQCRNTRKPNKI